MSKDPEVLKQEADEYLTHIKLYASHWGKALLIVGGTVFITYKIIKGVTSGQHKKQEQLLSNKQQYAVAPIKSDSRIVRMIKQQIGLFLIAIVKRKLTEALQKREMLHEDKVV